jgi:predicted transcriptional regulator
MAEETERKVFSLYVNQRKERINSILVELSKHNNPISLNSLIGQLAYKWGLRTSRLEEYFQQLKNAGLVTIHSEWQMGEENRTVKITKAGRETIQETSK